MEAQDMADIISHLSELELTNYRHRRFVPRERLRAYFTKDLIETICRFTKFSIEVYDHHQIVHAVLQDGFQLFATLVACNAVQFIAEFIKADHFSKKSLDSMLPLSEAALDEILKPKNTYIEATSSSNFSSSTEKTRSSTLQNQKRKILELQWTYVVPYFELDQSHRILNESTILPFLKRPSEVGAKGGFSDIYEVELPASHHGILDSLGRNVLLIRKQIRPDENRNIGEDFNREKHILSLLRCQRHPNIVQLVSSYTIDGTYNLLFPKAEGDLQFFLKSYTKPEALDTDDRILQALIGLSSALTTVHQYFQKEFGLRLIGCHNDLKPRNILFHNGKFLLSDFGLSRLRDENESSKSKTDALEGMYIAPESYDEDFAIQETGRASDIWSFGAILLEILTYLYGGPDEVKTFKEQRRVFYRKKALWHFSFHAHDLQNPNAGVVSCIQKRANNAETTRAHRTLLVLIANMLDLDQRRRPTAQEVTSRLFQINQMSVADAIIGSFASYEENLTLDLYIEKERFLVWYRMKDFGTYTKSVAQKSQAQMDDTIRLLNSYYQETTNILKNLVEINVSQSAEALSFLMDRMLDSESKQTRKQLTSLVTNKLLSTEKLSLLHDIKDLSRARKGYRYLGCLAAMKEIELGMQSPDDAPGESSQMLQDESQLSGSDKKTTELGSCSLHTFQPRDGSPPKRIILERMAYDVSWQGRTDELVQRIQQRLAIWSDRKHENTLNILRGLGYYHDTIRFHFGLLYEFPSTISNDESHKTNPITLWGFIRKTDSKTLATLRPPLDNIFDLGYKIATNILALHQAGWLHKAISSYNIIFFQKENQNMLSICDEPYLIGFNHSRQNNETAFTQGLTDESERAQLDYSHPEYLDREIKSRFCQQYDYYSLGLVLLEIGLWMRLDKLIKRVTGGPFKIRDYLVQEVVPKIGQYMGVGYENAVRACLEVGGLGDRSGLGTSDEEMRNLFIHKVVTPLARRLS